jgi:formate hydrogenlyase transcriptional activator
VPGCSADATVLIHGETGTGKEPIARAIHDQSPRHHAPYVKVNWCQDHGLLGELSGHSAEPHRRLNETTGRFQLADRGTISLTKSAICPELAQIAPRPPGTGVQRLGSGHTIRVNVRVVAATNLDLMEMVSQRGSGRSVLPAQRFHPFRVARSFRKISDLVFHLCENSRRGEPDIDVIPDVMEIFKSHDWPGNIRELQNFIERAVILSSGPSLRPPVYELKPARCAVPSAGRTGVPSATIIDVLRTAGVC